MEYLQLVMHQGGADEETLRSAIMPVLAASNEASDKTHQDMPAYRNLLRLVTPGLLVLAVGVAAGRVVWLSTSILLAPKGVGDGWAVALTFVAGTMGALFSAVPSLAQIPESTAPFNPVREQAMLKIAVGAWSGPIGLIVVTSGLQSAATSGQQSTATSTGTVAGFLLVAAVFGANQEALTRFADHNASALRQAAAS